MDVCERIPSSCKGGRSEFGRLCNFVDKYTHCFEQQCEDTNTKVKKLPMKDHKDDKDKNICIYSVQLASSVRSDQRC